MKIKTLEQARHYVLKVKVCLVFPSRKSPLPSLWAAVNLPERRPGEKGWGKKFEAVWAWKNELPAQFPEEIFYGKLPGGIAVLMCLRHLQQEHYPAHHRDVSACRPLARRACHLIRCEPLTSAALRRALTPPSGIISKSKVESALVELQATLNIVRSNDPAVKQDTWLPFAEQHPECVNPASRSADRAPKDADQEAADPRS